MCCVHERFYKLFNSICFFAATGTVPLLSLSLLVVATPISHNSEKRSFYIALARVTSIVEQSWFIQCKICDIRATHTHTLNELERNGMRQYFALSKATLLNNLIYMGQRSVERKRVYVFLHKFYMND